MLPRLWVSNILGGESVCFTFSGGDLVCLRPNYLKLADFDDVVCRFELADPGLFDHILRVLRDV